MQIMHELEKSLMNREHPEFRVGNTVKVHLRIVEGSKERIQVFQGVVIAIKKKMNRTTFTVRKVASGGYGVERVIPLFSPSIEKIEVLSAGRVRRSKLYFLRNRIGKSAKLREVRRAQ
ncbi:MAG: 50S ribosomal protein L19 [Acidobacteria bacterium]|nr:50S ribosomal protein L19 [Acidobacteriota bacterium]MCB9398462.1 50S ribosomal protein L19 [Acidobacteriota bacterium]